MNFCLLGLSVIETEAKAVFELTQRVDQHFQHACELLLHCKGRVVVMGMGKSGHIANKLAATFASTGTPAFFVHPSEACHGDLGMITPDDIVIALSNSGFTNEIVMLIPRFKRMGIPLIALTGNPASQLAKAATVTIDLSITQEACPLGLAPTTSTTVALVMGDALAIALLHARGFSAEDFALSHPGGSLGRRMLLQVNDISHSGDALPLVQEDASIKEALLEVTHKKLGMTCVVNREGVLTGVFTDGDIRRALTKEFDIHQTPLSLVMNRQCKTISGDLLAAEALTMMQKFSITALIVVDENFKPMSVVHLHDLLKAGII